MIGATGNKNVVTPTILSVNFDEDPGYSSKSNLQFSMMHRVKGVYPPSGIRIAIDIKLLSIHREFDPITTNILRHADSSPNRYIIVMSETSTVRITMDTKGKGDWQALSKNNEGREQAGAPAYGSMKDGESRDKPFGDVLKQEMKGANRLLARVDNWQEVFPTMKLEVISFQEKSRRYSTMCNKLKTRLTVGGEEMKPWYNFASWGVAYPENHNSQEATWPQGNDMTELKRLYEKAINEECQVWVDPERGWLVLYGDHAYVAADNCAPFVKVDRNAIRGMLITIPLSLFPSVDLSKYKVEELF